MVFLHFLQLYSGFLLSVISISLWKHPSFPSFCLHCAKDCKFFYVLCAIFSSLLQRSSIIRLSFLDLEVSQVSFSVIEENLIVLDSRLPCYYCIQSELLVFIVSKASFHFQIANCCHCLHFDFEKKLVSNCHFEK